MDAVFIVKVIRLTLSPVCKVVGLFVCPYKGTFTVSVVQANPALSSIQTVLHINILFLISNGYKVGVVILAGFLRFSPVPACLTGQVANTREVRPSWLAYVYKNKTNYLFSCRIIKIVLIFNVVYLLYSGTPYGHLVTATSFLRPLFLSRRSAHTLSHEKNLFNKASPLIRPSNDHILKSQPV